MLWAAEKSRLDRTEFRHVLGKYAHHKRNFEIREIYHHQ